MGETIARNKKAFHDYDVLEKFEAGLELLGSEVKACRDTRVNIKDSYVKHIKGELWLVQSHISVLETINKSFVHDELRFRKLLMKKKEIAKLHMAVQRDGLSLIALSLYFNDRNMIKLQVGLCKGKKLHDKRATMKDNTLKREADRAMKGDY